MGNRCADAVVVRAEGLGALPAGHKHFGAQHQEADGDAQDDASSVESENPEDQDHVFAFAGELPEEEVEALDEQYRAVLGDECAKVARAFQEARIAYEDGDELGVQRAPAQKILWTRKKIPKVPFGASVTEKEETHKDVLLSWQAAGYDLLGINRVAAIVLAGREDDGRFGKAAHIGMADIGLLSKKTPFQLLCERVLRAQSLVDSRKRALHSFLKARDRSGSGVERKRLAKLFGQEKCRSLDQPCRIPLFIMTNASDFHQVRNFFDAHGNFGLQKSQVRIFPQAEIPVFDSCGKVRLAAKNRIMTFPGGSGEIFRAVQDEGVLAELKARDVEFVWVGSVDNLLSKIADPTFVGFCKSSRVDIALKLVDRSDIEEELGVFLQSWADDDADESNLAPGAQPEVDVTAQGQARLMEYSHLTWRVRNSKRGADLVYRHASTCEFVFSMPALQDICRKNVVQHRWVPVSRPYVDWRRTGLLRTPPPSQKGSVRLQAFLGDCLGSVPKVGGFLVQRWGEFAPMKALEGRHSISGAIWMLSTAHQRWIRSAGSSGFAGFWDNSAADESHGRLCEVSPLVSYEGEGLAGTFLKGAKIDLPLHLEARREALESLSPRLEEFDLEDIALAERHQPGNYLAEESLVAAQEDRLQQEARRRTSAAASGEGRPLTGGEFAMGEGSERLPATPTKAEDFLAAKASALQRKQQRKLTRDHHMAIVDWQMSEVVQNALRQVTRLPHLDRLDEQRLKERMKKASSMGDSMSEAAVRLGSKTMPSSRMGSKASPDSRMGSKASPASRAGSKESPSSRAGSKASPASPRAGSKAGPGSSRAGSKASPVSRDGSKERPASPGSRSVSKA